MVQTIIIPDTTSINITIPANYIGKKMYAICYIDEEITPAIAVPTAQKPSDFFGTLSVEAGEKMHLYATKTRTAWNRDI
jgi:hypothetical protein